MPRKAWIAAISILFIYWCTYQGTEGYHFLSRVSFVQKQAINFTLLCAVGIIGYWGLLSFRSAWLSKLYLLIYCTVVGVIACLGLLDLLVHFSSPSFRNLVGYLRLFFTSPVPFSVLIFLHKTSSPAH